MNRIESVNDFVVRFANVNGSGSASANNLFARAIFRSGVPVSPKNIFPSNIQGLPTWYEVRVNGDGFLGRRGGVDMTIAVNGQTLYLDYQELPPGGYFIYDSTKKLADEFQRDDLVVITRRRPCRIRRPPDRISANRNRRVPVCRRRGASEHCRCRPGG